MKRRNFLTATLGLLAAPLSLFRKKPEEMVVIPCEPPSYAEWCSECSSVWAPCRECCDPVEITIAILEVPMKPRPFGIIRLAE